MDSEKGFRNMNEKGWLGEMRLRPPGAPIRIWKFEYGNGDGNGDRDVDGTNGNGGGVEGSSTPFVTCGTVADMYI